MTAHTPGPWESGRHSMDTSAGKWAIQIRIAGLHAFEIVRRCENEREFDELLANARLIAAAPALLEALQCAETVMILLQPEIDRLGCNAKNVLPKMKDAIRLAKEGK